MRSNCRTNILRQFTKIKQLPQNCQSKDCILVLDNTSSKLISFIISLQHIFQFGFKDLARADKKKKAQPNASAIYFISADSLHHVYQDFQNKPIYFSINILLCDQINDKMMKELSTKQNIIQRIASFGQLHIPCCYISQSCGKMHLNQLKKTNSLTLLSNIVNKMEIKKIIQYTKIILNSLITSNGNISSITIYYYDSAFNKRIVQGLKQLLVRYRQQNKQQKQQNNITLLLGQRQMDILSPLVYNFYYYPLLFQVLNAQHDQQNGKLIIKQGQQQLSIQMQNKIFLKYKNMHMYKAFQNINNDLQQFKQGSKTVKFQKGGQQNVKQVLKQLPQYNQTINNYKYNLQIMDKIGNLKSKYKLDQICQLQHTIVTSYNAKIQSQKDKKLLSRGLQFVQKTKNSLQKSKILLSMIFCLQLKNEQRQNLIKRLSMIQGYSQIAINIPKLLNKNFTKYKLMKYQNKKQYILDRHQSIICYALQQILKGNLPNQFKRLQIGQIITNIKTKKKKNQNHLNIVMTGGLGINQLSGLQKIGKRQGYQIQIICDGVVNGKTYLKQLAMI